MPTAHGGEGDDEKPSARRLGGPRIERWSAVFFSRPGRRRDPVPAVTVRRLTFRSRGRAQPGARGRAVPVLLELTARRGDDTYTVLYESGPALRGGTHVAVHLARS